MKNKASENLVDHSYFQLVAFFHRSTFDLVGQGRDMVQALNISFDSFWSHQENPDVLNNLVLLIECAVVEYSLTKKYGKVATGLYKAHLEKLEEIDLTKCMTKYEIEVFMESIEELNKELDHYDLTNGKYW